jgi:two-component system chemotaxis sensor kinase CheA
VNSDTVREVLSRISFVIIGWDEGDLMALSSLADHLESLRSLVGDQLELARLTTWVSQVVKASLTGGNPFQVAGASKALDLMERVLSALELYKEVPEELVNEVDELVVEKNLRPPVEKPQGTGVLDTETFQVFLSEAGERIAEAQGLVLELERDPDKKPVIDTLFRSFHTIKGECGFLKIVSLGELAHNVESLLDLLRRGEVRADEEVVELLLSGIDHARAILDGLSRGDVAIFNQVDTGDFFARLHARISARKTSLGEVLQAEGKLSEADVVKILQKQKESSYTKKFGEIAQEENLVTPEDIHEAVLQQKSPQTQDWRHDPLIKVRSSQVSFLVDMIGELLIVENQLDEKDKNVVQLKKITRQLQTAAMQLRTVTVKNLFVNVGRIARDASRKLGKNVRLTTLGDELEIDRNLVEILEEPLLHLVRNSIGHGIEPAELRQKLGKPAEGEIQVSAQRHGNSIVLAVRDDGAGLDEAKILKTALEKGLVSAERRTGLSRNEIFQFIFLPGFSTAEKIDAISGRGVGLDIVKSSVTSARGRVEIRSETGAFTEFSLIFPMSLAIIDGLIVESAGTLFILPIASIVESLKIDPSKISRVEDRVSVLDLRGEVLPVIGLGEYFFPASGRSESGFAVIVENQEKRFALLVDDVVAKKEVVIKPLGKKFRHLSALSSAAVLPGGRIGFVVNVEEVVRA